MYDICIIGGGINGVSTALQCSEKGHSVILFEQRTLASGASSKTSKLAHGGLRYLENLEFGLVKESLQERNRLIEEYPDLVKPLPFIFPTYSTFMSMKIWAGLKLYDKLAKGSPMPPSKRIKLDEAKLCVPWLDMEDVKSTFQYYDAVMDDKGIAIKIANKARNRSAELFSEEKVIRVIQKPNLVKVQTNKRLIKCKVLVNVTGAWNKELTSPSKGVHLVTNKLKSDTATILINPRDDRVFFTIPHNSNQTIIGTTDDIYDGDPDKVRVEDRDRDYIINAINTFSTEQITTSDVVDEYAGLRPLAKSKGTSRDFVIHKDSRVVSMVGGKYTTHRAMCERLTDQVEQLL